MFTCNFSRHHCIPSIQKQKQQTHNNYRASCQRRWFSYNCIERFFAKIVHVICQRVVAYFVTDKWTTRWFQMMFPTPRTVLQQHLFQKLKNEKKSIFYITLKKRTCLGLKESTRNLKILTIFKGLDKFDRQLFHTTLNLVHSHSCKTTSFGKTFIPALA